MILDTAGHAFAEERTLPSSVLGLAKLTGFYFAFRMFIMTLSVHLLGTDPQTGVMCNLVLNVLLLLAVALQTVGSSNPTRVVVLRLPITRWVLLFLVFSGCSLAWSVTSSLAAALAFWSGMAADVGIIFLLLSSAPVTELTDSLMKGFVWGGCGVALVAWLLPAQADMRLGDEGLLGPNQIGYMCAFAFFLAQYRLRIGHRGGMFTAGVLLITLLRSLSKTTIVALVLAETFLLARDKSLARKTKWMVASLAAILITLFWGLLASYLDAYVSTGSGNSAETLTGRVGIWAVLLSEAIQRPWFGHGFHSVWKVIPSFGEFEARHAHNELLQQFYAYGVIGICMLAGLYGSLYRHVRKLQQGPLRVFLTAFLIFILIRGLADTEPFDLSLPLWAIVMFSLLVQHQLDAQTLLTEDFTAERTDQQTTFDGATRSANVIPL
jgi:exopolysaccharide production protein ExoQ